MAEPGRKVLSAVLIGLLAASLYTAALLEGRFSSEAVMEQIGEIIEQVQEIRGLMFKEKPTVIVITRHEALRMWKPGKADLERMHREELVYKMTLLLPPDYQYVKEESGRSAGWIAATSGNTIYVIQENFIGDPDTAKRAMAHELTHVLQKQWFDARYGSDTFDGSLAAKALIEGDADLVADIYCERNGIPIHKIRSLSGNALTDINIFPYVFGDKFVRYLYEKGNWSLVNRAYERYPETALEVMKPELYLEGFTPASVQLDVPAGVQVLRDDRLGAFYVYVLLRDVAKLGNESAWNVSSAWFGDRLVLTTNGTVYVLLWKVEFSNENASKTFGETLSRLAEGNTYANYTIRIDGSSVLLIAERRE
ncbi:hypothetical protein CL1_1303 [Thermococcus cleftensis]|uniref:eCIS core domain-containing protein n=1 Tax=Thermococcus cleftensis (strain DSM 27260 / KACC 17922 / CL1) TaxID=163003 RepID=I3ZUW8_THECF|nr:DUF4157 domain-containing protein [Thermococcus cleftensis]AFL95502.1 hypothetical protein CL1_1303 [Thermococcus cleftensis]